MQRIMDQHKSKREIIKTERLTTKGICDLCKELPCEKDLYKKIVNTFHSILSEEMMNTGTRYKLPHRLGTLGIRKKKTSRRKRRVDFAKTKQYGVTVYHNNYHSEGFYAFYHWNKDYPQATFTYKQLYKFIPTRGNKRRLARKISDENKINKYLEI